MALNPKLFTSTSAEWETPQDLYDELNEIFKFEVDVCATHENAKHPIHFTLEEDGLKQDWTRFKSCWMNPPYGRVIGRWVRKAFESSLTGTVIVCLLPARTDTIWWHEYCMRGKIRFLKGRLKFDNRLLPAWRPDGSHKRVGAPFPSAIVVFGEQ